MSHLPSDDYIFGNKPSGITTHQSASDKPGYQEWLEHCLEQKLFTVHRLDKETSGAIFFALHAEAAKTLSLAFLEQRVKKEYLFITDRPLPQSEWTHRSLMKSKSGAHEIPSETHFRLIKQWKHYSLVQAQPKTGKTHQIRIHAMKSNIPLLGDTTYKGTTFPTFFLHCHKLSIADLSIEHLSEPPYIFNHIEVLENPLLCMWLNSIDRRLRLYPELHYKTLRWIHDEGTPLRLDKFLDVTVAGWWRNSKPTIDELTALEKLFSINDISNWLLLHYSGQRTQDQVLIDHCPHESWIAFEGPLQFLMRKDSGLSCGLFLDQRDNRNWVLKNSKNKKVLNLFAYTGGFSVAAAVGAATHVTTVDLSKTYTQWCKENFSLNNLQPETHSFYSMDSFEFLNYADRKNLQYDLIICDPPSFSRSKNGRIFRIDKDFPQLITSCLKVLAPKGTLIFCTNYEKWTSTEWLHEINASLPSENIKMTYKTPFNWDFEMGPQTHMKTFFLEKK